MNHRWHILSHCVDKTKLISSLVSSDFKDICWLGMPFTLTHTRHLKDDQSTWKTYLSLRPTGDVVLGLLCGRQ